MCRGPPAVVGDHAQPAEDQHLANNLTGALPKKRLQVLASASHLRSMLAAAYEAQVALCVRPVCHAGPLPDQWANLLG